MSVQTETISFNNQIIYKHACSTIEELHNIPEEQVTLGSIAIVDGKKHYLANSQGKWSFINQIQKEEYMHDGTDSFKVEDVYPTLAALQAAFPTGNGNAYQVTAENEEIFIWSERLSAWTSIGVLKGLKGDKGDGGDTGKSAYDIAVEQGYTGTEVEFGTDLANAGNYAATANTKAQEAAQSASDAQEAADSVSPLMTVGPDSVVSISNAAQADADKIVVDIAPTQDLHGYDKPWPAGGGKNLVDMSTTVTGYYNETGAFVQSSDGGFYTTALIPVESNTTYTASFYDASGNRIAGLVYTEWDENGNIVSQQTSTSITTGSTVAYLRLRNFAAQGTTMQSEGTNARWQLEKGSSFTTYMPYSNICPISGWTGATVTRCGRNLLDASAAEIGTAWNGASNPARARLAVPVKRNTQYILTMNGTNALDGVYSTLSRVIPPTGIDARTFPYSFDSGENDYLVLGFNKAAISQADIDALNLQLELGSTASAYESYQGSTLSIPFPTAADTVYGGTLTINEDGSGTLVVDRGLFTVTTAKIDAAPNTGYHAATGSAWVRNLNYNEGVRRVRYGNDNPRGQCPCNFAEKVVLNNNDISSSQYRTSFKGSWTTFAEFREAVAALEDAGITPYYVALLNTPWTTYTLTAEQVALLRGNNTLWADCGDVTLTYWQDGVIYENYYTKTQTDNLLNAKADSADIPTNVSELTNDAGYLVPSSLLAQDVTSQYTITKTSGNLTITNFTVYKVGGIIYVRTEGTTSAVTNSGGDLFVGTISGPYMPKIMGNGLATYYGDCIVAFSVQENGTLNYRAAGGSSYGVGANLKQGFWFIY